MIKSEVDISCIHENKNLDQEIKIKEECKIEDDTNFPFNSEDGDSWKIKEMCKIKDDLISEADVEEPKFTECLKIEEEYKIEDDTNFIINITSEATVEQPESWENFNNVNETNIYKREKENPKFNDSKMNTSSTTTTCNQSNFACTYCTQILISQKQLDRHSWKDHRKSFPDLKFSPGSIFTCDLCEYESPSNARLTRHKWSHGIGKLKKCPKCDYATAVGNTLTQHINNVHSEKKEVHTCECCLKKFAWKNSLANHLLNSHKDKVEGLEKIFNWKVRRCEFCDFRTTLDSRLTRHAEIHSDNPNATKLRCYHCDYATRYKTSLIAHVAKHTGNQFKCQYCEEAFRFQHSLDRHLLTAHGTLVKEQELKSRVFSCTLCNFKTIDHHSLKYHTALKHEKVTNNTNIQYYCQLCNFAIDDRDDLISHCKTKHDKYYRAICKLCSKAFFAKIGYANHLLQKHKTEEGRTLFKEFNYKMYSCKLCSNYKTLLRNTFQRHMFVTHKDKESIKPEHSCSKCDYKSPSKAHLRSHIYTRHSNEKLYSCLHCENQHFKHKHTFAMHILRKHENEVKEDKIIGYKVLSCSLCGYKSLRGRDLCKHTSVHHT